CAALSALLNLRYKTINSFSSVFICVNLWTIAFSFSEHYWPKLLIDIRTVADGLTVIANSDYIFSLIAGFFQQLKTCFSEHLSGLYIIVMIRYRVAHLGYCVPQSAPAVMQWASGGCVRRQV
ncbi:MAG: hypothetical protein RQ982_12965, partial [Gammaproteobacteria bacterium]|nr:hypothetical protein [Gammaproteobacteria bacterium]